MTAPVSGTPMRVELVAWSGHSDELAALLRVPEPDLLRRLRRIAQGDKGRLAVQVRLANTGPTLSALARRLNPKEAET